MTVYYDKTKKRFRADVWYNNKRYKSRSFRLKALAVKFERDCLNEIDRIKLTGVQYQDLTYSEIFQIWRANADNRKRATSLIKDDQMNSQYVEPIIGHLRIKEISSGHFVQIISFALKRGLSESSVNKVIQHFKAVFMHAVTNELIPRNPSQSVKQLKFQNKEMDFYYKEELDDFLSYANEKYKEEDRVYFVLYLTLFVTGMRLGEVLGLTWDSVDLQRGIIHIGQIWCSSESKIIEVTKGKSDRRIPMPTVLNDELTALKKRRNYCKATDLIMSFSGELPIDASNFRKRHWEADAKSAKVRRIRIHDARHTYGAHFMMNGGRIYELQKVLGHKSITTTERYAHLAPNHLDRVRDIIKPDFGSNDGVVLVKNNPLPVHSLLEMKRTKEAVSV